MSRDPGSATPPVAAAASRTIDGARRQLSHFLRTRRERLRPGEVGLPAGSRRRARGLRREEVAELCGISADWYTRLEQGRPVRVSSDVLERLAHACAATPAYRRLLVDWESEARRVLARFRADHGRHAAEPEFEALVSELSGGSPEFRRWWPEHRVESRRDGRKEFQHPSAGRIVLEHTAFFVADDADLKVVIYTPLPEAGTPGKLERLLRAAE